MAGYGECLGCQTEGRDDTTYLYDGKHYYFVCKNCIQKIFEYLAAHKKMFHYGTWNEIG